jgi:hypothetical protein
MNTTMPNATKPAINQSATVFDLPGVDGGTKGGGSVDDEDTSSFLSVRSARTHNNLRISPRAQLAFLGYLASRVGLKLRNQWLSSINHDLLAL